MTDRIDPGPGWRLLEAGEIVKEGDECRDSGKWVKSYNYGLPQYDALVYRRRLASPRATKAIATRATVICGTPDGARTINTISRESGLTEYDCERIRRAWDNMQVSTAKYIMLEIQREGES